MPINSIEVNNLNPESIGKEKFDNFDFIEGLKIINWFIYLSV